MAVSRLDPPVKCRFDVRTLARSGFNVFAAALEIPAGSAWEQTNQGAWDSAAGSVIHIIEQAALTNQNVMFDDLATVIATMLNSDYASCPTVERIAFYSIAVLWANAVKTRDLDITTIENEAIYFAKKKVEQSKPKEPESNGTANGKFLHEAMVSVEPVLLPVTKKDVLVDRSTSSGLHAVINIKIADYQRKIDALNDIKKNMPPAASEALWELMCDTVKGEKS